MFLWMLVACGTPEPKESAPPPDSGTPSTTPSVSVSPETLDFGVIGAPGALTLTVANSGSDVASVVEASVGTADLILDVAASDIPPGGTTTVTATWSPLGPGALSDTIKLLVLTSDAGARELSVPVLGTASWPVLSLTAETADLGSVIVGCDASTTVTVANTGTADLVVDGLALQDNIDFQLSATEGELPTLPWTLAAGTSQVVALTFTPTDEVGVTDTLIATSNDPLAPEVSLAFAANGSIEAQDSLTYIADDREPSTIIFAVNDYDLVLASIDRFWDALPTFLETLQDQGTTYRMTFLTAMSGEVRGDIPYIDDSVSPDDAYDIIVDMLDAPSITDNDYLLDTFEKAFAQNEDWLMDDDGGWDESELSFIGINNDVEQSTGTGALHVATYQTYKEDPGDIVVHAFAGEPPRGCTDAEPSQALYDATEASGGTFYSYCDTDWTSSMTDLAAALVGDRAPFLLTSVPQEWSIEVYLDGVESTSGWTYDATNMEIVFDEDAYPAAGTTVRIDYILATECTDAP